MATNYIQRGDHLTYANDTGSDIAAGDVVVIGNILGVAQDAIADGTSGSVDTEGVFTLPKVSGAVFTQGEKLIWDASASAFDDSAATPGPGDVTGDAVAWAAGADGEITASVRISPSNSEVG